MLVSIRQARTDDIPALERLIPESVRVLSDGYYTSEQIESALLHIFGVDTQLIEDGTYFVAEIDGRIVGCGGWSQRRTLFGGDQTKSGDGDGQLDPAKEPARIRAFFVHPRWARQGIGGRIMQCCEARARESSFTGLELVATLPGEPLYSAFGFVVTERLEIGLPNGAALPACRMVKRLEQT